jgi:hypothetical protein
MRILRTLVFALFLAAVPLNESLGKESPDAKIAGIYYPTLAADSSFVSLVQSVGLGAKKLSYHLEKRGGFFRTLSMSAERHYDGTISIRRLLWLDACSSWYRISINSTIELPDHWRQCLGGQSISMTESDLQEALDIILALTGAIKRAPAF